MSLFTREASSFFHTYKRLPLQIARGEGMYLFTADGTQYLDMFAGIAVNALGHAHPRVVRAIADQASRYIHVSNYFAQEPQIRLAELLLRHSGTARVFFTNSGTEAMEGALKIARQWGSGRGKTHIAGFSNAFHGRTYGALSVMDRPAYRDGFGPFLDNCDSLPFNDSDALRSAVGPQTAAVVLECIQGEGGIRPVTAAFVDTLKELRKQHGFLVIADEIQTGTGRTGRFLASEHFALSPDIITLAKPIGGGLPLGAILGAPSVADVLQPGMHGTTFGGNPVACAAGIAVLEEIEERGLMQHATEMGNLLLSRLRDCSSAFPKLCKEVRGVGLMVGLELTVEAEPVVAGMRERGILINGTDKTVLRFVPPLIVNAAEINRTVDTLREVLSGVSSF
ncbi:MAG: aspartate aminotransferase family protein [Bacteroidetes bacterium]|nr:aspartate aminotransferase family protein [Bacteroidota bacterium]